MLVKGAPGMWLLTSSGYFSVMMQINISYAITKYNII